MRRVNDGSEAVDGRVHAKIGNGESSALVFFGLELAVPSTGSEILHLSRDGLETETLNALDNWSHETNRCGNSDLTVR